MGTGARVRELPIFRHTDYLQFDAKPDPEPLGGPGSAPAPDPKLYATYDGKQGEPSGPARPRHRNWSGRKIKDALTWSAGGSQP
jgi:hypothetical protein